MLRDIHLHGRLRKKFAPVYRFDCDTPAEGIRAMLLQIPGFRQELEQGSYRVRVVNKGKSMDLDEETLKLDIADAPAIHITPVVAGRKNRGVTKIILGIVIIATAWFTGGASLAGWGMGAGATGGLTLSGAAALMGASIAISGIAMLLSPVPKMGGKDKKQSFLFDGVENVYEQGGPVPVVYGQHMVGSVVISAGIMTEDIYVRPGGGWNDPGGGEVLP